MQMWDSSALWVTLFSLLTGTSHHRVQRSLFALGRSLHRSLLATCCSLTLALSSLLTRSFFLSLSFCSTLLLFYSTLLLFFLLSSFSILLFSYRWFDCLSIELFLQCQFVRGRYSTIDVSDCVWSTVSKITDDRYTLALTDDTSVSVGFLM